MPLPRSVLTFALLPVCCCCFFSSRSSGVENVHYVSRVGLDHVKRKILDDAEGRKALWAQLQFSLQGEPGPWFDFDKAKVDLRQFDKVSA